MIWGKVFLQKMFFRTLDYFFLNLKIYICTDRYLQFNITEGPTYFYPPITPNMLPGITKRPISKKGKLSLSGYYYNRVPLHPAVNIRSHAPYGFSKAISCTQKQSFLFIKGLWAIWKEVIRHFHLSLISNIAHLHCHWQRLQATAIKIYCVTKERLTGLSHWDYIIFIDTFSAVQEDFSPH